jgi:hypothetical protein
MKKMSRAKEFMSSVWEQRNNQGADTEEKLVAAILSIASNYVISYTAQNNTIVLDKNDLIQLSEEIKLISH